MGPHPNLNPKLNLNLNLNPEMGNCTLVASGHQGMSRSPPV